MARRRKLSKRKDTDWELLIKNCLHNGIGTNKWGCLNKSGKLFRVSTLNSIQVPKQVIESMQRSGLLKLKDDDYYTYNTPIVQKRARRKLNY